MCVYIYIYICTHTYLIYVIWYYISNIIIYIYIYTYVWAAAGDCPGSPLLRLALCHVGAPPRLYRTQYDVIQCHIMSQLIGKQHYYCYMPHRSPTRKLWSRLSRKPWLLIIIIIIIIIRMIIIIIIAINNNDNNDNSY